MKPRVHLKRYRPLPDLFVNYQDTEKYPSIQMIPTNSKKRQRGPHHAPTTRHSSTDAITRLEPSQRLRPIASASSFNDDSTGDVILRFYLDSSFHFDAEPSVEDDVEIYLHSDVLRRSKYFAALLSDRWQYPAPINSIDSDNGSNVKKLIRLSFAVSDKSSSISDHVTVIRLLYTDDFSSVINSVTTALDLLPVALELLFEDCINACVKFIEAVPWTEEEEKRVIEIVPLLREEDSRELLSRVSSKDDSCEDMLHGLVLAAIHNHPHMAFVKAFVAKLLREFASRESARRVLEVAFEESLKIVKESLEEYSSPDFRGYHNETEAIQRLNLHTALTNGRHLVWLVERMIELRVADKAVKEWSEQAAFTADLQRAFRDDAWRGIVPGLPSVVMRCTCKLANGVAAGTILADRQVRMKLVREWLPVLIVCKDNVSPLCNQRTLYLELEETLLRIISTLLMSDAQELLQQCLSFSTKNVEDCPHLVTAFNTWFRRATQPSLLYDRN